MVRRPWPALTLLLGACVISSSGTALVTVDGSLSPGADFDALWLDVHRSSDGALVHQEQLWPGEQTGFPFSFTLTSSQSAPPATGVRFTARALQGGNLVAAAEGAGRVRTQPAEPVPLTLARVTLPGTLPNGAACDGPDDCVSAFCADGVCCASACDGPCDSCNLPDRLGRCEARAKGDPGVPSCGLTTCDGVSSACAAGCGPTQSCAPGVDCSPSGSCLGKLETLTDDFDQPLDAGTWSIVYNNGNPTTVYTSGGQLQLGTLTTPGLSQLYSNRKYDFQGSSATIELVSAGNQTYQSRNTWFSIRVDAANYIAIHVQKGNLRAARVIGDVYSDMSSEIPYNPQTMRFLRMREAGGTTHFEYSADGGSYTSLHSVANPMPVREVFVLLEATTTATEAGTSQSSFDRLNVP